MTQTVPVWQAMVALLGTIILALIGHIIAVAKLKTDIRQKNFENSMRVVETHDAAYRTYTAALKAYGENPEPKYEDFMKIVSAGDIYFHQYSLICNSMLSGLVDVNIRDNTWIPKIRVVLEKTLPYHYQTLKNASEKGGFPYTGELRRCDHESIYAAAEMFSTSSAWLRSHEELGAPNT
ncbi:MAG: hypothetical protein QM645_09205 [Asticcacaulis sp.]